MCSKGLCTVVTAGDINGFCVPAAAAQYVEACGSVCPLVPTAPWSRWRHRPMLKVPSTEPAPDCLEVSPVHCVLAVTENTDTDQCC